MKRIPLRKARQRAKLTQEQLEQKSGVPQATISKLETGRLMNPRWDDVLAIADALNLDPQQLKFGSSEVEAVA